MNIIKHTTNKTISEYLADYVRSYLPEKGDLQTYCLAATIKLGGTQLPPTEEHLLWKKGVRIVDVFDDRTTPDKAIKFYLKSENVEAHLLFGTDSTVSLEINDIGSAKYEQGYVKQKVHIPSGETTRRITCDASSVEVMMRLIMETKW